MEKRLIDKCYSKIVGTNSGSKNEKGKSYRQLYLAIMKKHDLRVLSLVREPENIFDPLAIAVYCDLPEYGRKQIGYIQNSKRSCLFCNREYSKGQVKETNTCPLCGGELTRTGLAHILAPAMDAGEQYKCIVTAYTGSEDSILGCNIQIERIAS